MTEMRVILIGSESLTIEAGRQMLERGYAISAVVTLSEDVSAWAASQDLPAHGFGADLAERIGETVDWVFSVANLKMLNSDVLALGRKGAINFHDGPLPRYAGLNAPVWALLNGEAQHGITWHVIDGGVDEGGIIAQQMFDIQPSDTAFTLNTRCFEAAVQSFAQVLDAVETDGFEAQQQDLSGRSYYGLAHRPEMHGFIDHTRPKAEALRLVRALDHGPYWNPLCTAKLRIGAHIFHVQSATSVEGSGRAGAVLERADGSITLGFPDGAVQFSGVHGPLEQVGIGDLAALQTIDPETAEALEQAAKSDGLWRQRLLQMVPCSLALAEVEPRAVSAEEARVYPVPGADTGTLSRALLYLAQQMNGTDCDIAFGFAHAPPLLSSWAPVRDMSEVETARSRGPFAQDVWVRDARLSDAPMPALGIGDAPIAGCAVTVCGTDVHIDPARLSPQAAELICARLSDIAASLSAGTSPEKIPAAELALMDRWNATDMDVPETCTPQLIEAQAARTPDAIALVAEDRSLTYAALNAAANRVANVLRDMGVGPEALVGLYTSRSLDMVIGALGIMKAGGAYVPLDPAYPEHRIAGYLEDANPAVIVTQRALSGLLPQHDAPLLEVDADPRLEDASADNPAPQAAPETLAYVIFTSGSTGRPKGVMIEHRNLNNFIAGMDARIAHDGADRTWLAVTSLNFDISVLEIFYTLSRGFKVVLTSDETRAVISNGPVARRRGDMDFSIYYWGNDDGAGAKKYELLLEGAKFADQNGFCAVWTPERHFHAFGGPYPNPSVTGAAVAAVTENIGVRSGSCVAPLHHPARIAEEWSVIDNLTNGRAGLAMASGWQPDDFVLRPENTPPDNKPALMETIEQVRALWRGEPVAFAKADGSMHEVITQPRPVSKEVPIWVTTAGNPETWKEAGRIGAHVLTHLLGQSIAEVAEKIILYHAALREAGHDPADFKVTLMLHTFLAETREQAREIAREPMKDYLRSAAGLIKQYAWAFPAFKRPEGVDNAFQLDLGSLEEDELEGILDFAFLRYFEDSGLFGTQQDAVARVEALKKIGVNEVACLIDYGISPAQVMEGLRPLAEVVKRTNTTGRVADDDFSIAAQMVRHEVTHLQCTPSMARMICMNDEARDAMSDLQHIFVGGEALPSALVADLKAAATGADITNMYGPTETTIWSSTRHTHDARGTVPLGQPIANTQFFVIGEDGGRCPVGVAGELCIGGAGVTRGYLGRDDLTKERFVAAPDGGRMYRTGDLVRMTASGDYDYIGRVDTQIKLRGYRIELGEIEAALEAQTGVRQAVVAAREDSPGDVRLVGYVTGDGLAPAALRAALKAALPAHMVPSSIEVLESFPLTPNKKVDRAALPVPVRVAAPTAAQPVPKVTAAPSEPAALRAPAADAIDATVQIAAIWSRILGVETIAPTDNFFDIGGHSLLAVQAHREIRDQLGAKLSITDIFRFPVLSALASRVSETGGCAANLAQVQVAKAAPKASRTDALAARAGARAEAMAKRKAMRASRVGR